MRSTQSMREGMSTHRNMNSQQRPAQSKPLPLSPNHSQATKPSHRSTSLPAAQVHVPHPQLAGSCNQIASAGCGCRHSTTADAFKGLLEGCCSKTLPGSHPQQKRQLPKLKVWGQNCCAPCAHKVKQKLIWLG
jgi:hypothetical protein